jgi:aconitate hydratase
MEEGVFMKIFKSHVKDGSIGGEVGLQIDQTLTQDATGTLAYLEFEALGIPKVKTKLSVSYVDHNMLQTTFENADDHAFLQSIASKYGILFSKPGNGICHQVHLERFGVPGQTLLGSDSHTPTNGGLGMIAIGAGGLDVAIAMGGGLFYLKTPKIVGVKLTGKLRKGVNAKDVILEILRQLTVKGGVGKVFEYFGEGVKSLSVPERATITNMGAELGATTSIFPSDENTFDFLKKQKREKHFKKIEADSNAQYDEVIEINLSELVPMAAKPSSPDNVVKISEIEGLKVDQVLVGSCTNSSIKDMSTVAAILKGKHVHNEVSFAVSPGSRQVLEQMAENGMLATMIQSGARILETACGPCIGMGQAPRTGAISLRTFNRNFEGRSGTKNDKVYLVSPEVAAASAITGKITDPTKIKFEPIIPKDFVVDDSMILKPSFKNEIIRGPNIAPLPIFPSLPSELSGKVLLKVGDDITTDHIMPAGSKILPLRSNIPKISEHVFENVDLNFVKRAKESNGGFIVGGLNYGQGSSREHAALAPRYLGVTAVIAKTFARIHKANLVNFGILPLQLKNPSDYDFINQGDELSFSVENLDKIIIFNKTSNKRIEVVIEASERDKKILKAGGSLNFIKGGSK